jgi:hypothetical protein
VRSVAEKRAEKRSGTSAQPSTRTSRGSTLFSACM